MISPHSSLQSWPPSAIDLERFDRQALALMMPADRLSEGGRFVADGAVDELCWTGPIDGLRAVVDGHLVRIRPTRAICGCGAAAPCPCIAATLIAWLEQRVELLDRGGEGASLAELIQHALIEGCGDLRGEVDLPPSEASEASHSQAPRIMLDLSGSISGKIGLEGRWLPALLELEGAGIEVGNTLRAARRPEQPLRPVVAAEFDEEGGVALEWFYRLDDTPGPDRCEPAADRPAPLARGVRVEREDVVDAKALGGWTWVDRTLHPVVGCEPALARYWGKVRHVPPSATFEFVRTQLPALRQCPQFEAGPKLTQARVVRNLEVRRVSVHRDSDPRWFYLEPRYGDADLDLALDQLRAWRDEGRTRVRQGPLWIELPTEAELSRFQRLFGGERGKPGRLSGAELLRYAADWHGQVEIDAQPQTRALVDRLLGRGPMAAAPAHTPGLACALRDYQQEGLAWLEMLTQLELGGVLADEMGLGKTVQTLALLVGTHLPSAAADAVPSADSPCQEGAGPAGEAAASPPPSLVICPRSVLDHWVDQARRLAPGLKIHVHHGSGRNARDADAAHLWLTTYETASRDIKRLGAQPWSLLILDEAQKAKNVRTRTARALRKLDARARFALTGTPIENSLLELWALFDLLAPDHLGPQKRFAERFVKPIEEREDESARELLGRLVRPLILRRKKADVLDDLPEKIEDIRSCRLSAQQELFYRQALERQAPRILEQLADRHQTVDYISILAVLTKLKQICDHPSLVLSDEDLGADPLATESGKFDVFSELLDELLDAGHKVVVFSQYLKMLDLLALHCDRKQIGWTQLRGATRDRAAVVERFRDDPSCRIFLASLGAAGVGIELTAASAVIHYDRWWTAAREDQATDRVHRIGQNRGVLVYKLMTRGTIEERIDELINRKRQLARNLLDGESGSLKQFDRQELIQLFAAPER